MSPVLSGLDSTGEAAWIRAAVISGDLEAVEVDLDGLLFASGMGVQAGQRRRVFGSGFGGLRLTVSMMSRSASGERIRAARRRSAESRKGC